MKKSFPKYKAGDMYIIKQKLNKSDKEIFDKFMVYVGGGAGERALRKAEAKILQIRDVSETQYDKWDLDSLRKFLLVLNKSELSPATKNDVKKVLKRFLKDQYPDWNTRFKDLKDVRGESDVNQQRINADTILQPDELEKIIRTADSLRLKALIMLMYETAGRPGEILERLKWKDINLDKGEVKLISTKNNTARVLPIKESIIHLKRYKQEYPFPDVQPNDWVFPSLNDRKGIFSVQYFGKIFGDLTKKAIGRRLFPYIIRHSRATELQKVLPPKIYEKFMDHSIEMASRYSHLNKDDVKEAMNNLVYHVEEISPEENASLEKLKKEVKELRGMMTSLVGRK